MSLPACTWISGDEPLLVEEALENLRTSARAQKYTRKIFHVDSQFDWSQFSEQCQSLSLFSDKQFIECRFKQSKLSDEGKAALTAYIDKPCDDIAVVITSGKLDAAMQKTAWFKKLSAGMKLIAIWPLQAQAFRQWLHTRSQQIGIKLAPDAMEYLAVQTEGNLLAAKQALERLSLLNDESVLTVERLRSLQHDASVYDLFDLVDCALSGNAAKTVHIFHQLIAQGDCAPVLMLWALHREITTLLSMKKGESPYTLPHRKNLVNKALQRLSEADLLTCLKNTAPVDAALKGMGESDGLSLLLDLYILIAGSIIQTKAPAPFEGGP